eukprot:CAMPEP_0172428982 /NCGR_PEP_ID=MMETSP1064-20121228/48515_1 /TAXON_ID=202472 /ORGANISM="Aulacoseira subarctica , Strain CCAP 1002/5" /LENGTH=63 /DNA_ID=CAMNT_0013174071 /DNA_START=30 /DNA_END=218 /DNA_ORIENTATION=+
MSGKAMWTVLADDKVESLAEDIGAEYASWNPSLSCYVHVKKLQLMMYPHKKRQAEFRQLQKQR